MTPLTFDQIDAALRRNYGEKANSFPDYYSDLLPSPSSATQLSDVQAAVQQLAGNGCPPAFEEVLSRWDLTNLNVAGFSFGFKGSFAGRLLSNNQWGNANSWWDDAFTERPKTWLFIAQGDPYVILLDVQSGDVLAYQAADGANTAMKIAGDFSTCLRMLSTVQLHKADSALEYLTVSDIKAAVGADCDDRFWTEQIDHWTQFN